jgi:hypothetical protein
MCRYALAAGWGPGISNGLVGNLIVAVTGAGCWQTQAEGSVVAKALARAAVTVHSTRWIGFPSMWAAQVVESVIWPLG